MHAALSALAVVAVLFALWQMRLRREWKRRRNMIAVVLAMGEHELAEEHPNALRDRLRTVREAEAIHHAFAQHPTIREVDRESTERHLAEAGEAAQKIRRAMEASVRTRVDRGIAVPAMETSVPTTQESEGPHDDQK